MIHCYFNTRPTLLKCKCTSTVWEMINIVYFSLCNRKIILEPIWHKYDNSNNWFFICDYKTVEIQKSNELFYQVYPSSSCHRWHPPLVGKFKSLCSSFNLDISVGKTRWIWKPWTFPTTYNKASESVCIYQLEGYKMFNWINL